MLITCKSYKIFKSKRNADAHVYADAAAAMVALISSDSKMLTIIMENDNDVLNGCNTMPKSLTKDRNRNIAFL